MYSILVVAPGKNNWLLAQYGTNAHARALRFLPALQRRAYKRARLFCQLLDQSPIAFICASANTILVSRARCCKHAAGRRVDVRQQPNDCTRSAVGRNGLRSRSTRGATNLPPTGGTAEH